MYRSLVKCPHFVLMGILMGTLWIASANARSGEVIPTKLAGQLAELAAIPDMEMTAQAIERITGIKLAKDELPPAGTQQRNANRWRFGPDAGHPYGFYLDGSSQRTQFNFAWREYGRQYLPFQRAPAGMCVPATSLIESLVGEGWQLKYEMRYRDAPPGGLFFRGEHGRLELSFDDHTDCLITFSLTSATYLLT